MEVPLYFLKILTVDDVDSEWLARDSEFLETIKRKPGFVPIYNLHSFLPPKIISVSSESEVHLQEN